MILSDILSFWSTLKFKYWRRYINFKIWPILWPGDVINEVVNIYLYNCSYNLMIHMHRKFNDDIFARRLVIMKKMLLFHILRNIEGRLWGHPVTSSMTSSSWKYFFVHYLGRSFHICGQIEAVFNVSKWSPFWARDKLFTGSYTGRRIYQKDSHEHFRHFELLIDAVIQIFTHFGKYVHPTVCLFV